LIGLKSQVRICGIDDAPFEFGNRDAKAIVIGTIVRIPAYLEGVLKFDVSVDGDDSTSNIEKAIDRSRFKAQIKAIMLDGIALAGFNVVDIEALSSSTGIPVITVTRDEPDMDSIKSALRKYFKDADDRLARISKMPIKKIQTPHNPIYVSYAGIAFEEVRRLIETTTLKGVIPEPIRMAHIIASGISRGESRGKA